jgi:hypothetical protein
MNNFISYKIHKSNSGIFQIIVSNTLKFPIKQYYCGNHNDLTFIHFYWDDEYEVDQGITLRINKDEFNLDDTVEYVKLSKYDRLTNKHIFYFIPTALLK